MVRVVKVPARFDVEAEDWIASALHLHRKISFSGIHFPKAFPKDFGTLLMRSKALLKNNSSINEHCGMVHTNAS